MSCAYDVCIYVNVLLYTSGALHALSSLYQFTSRNVDFLAIGKFWECLTFCNSSNNNMYSDN